MNATHHTTELHDAHVLAISAEIVRLGRELDYLSACMVTEEEWATYFATSRELDQLCEIRNRAMYGQDFWA